MMRAVVPFSLVLAAAGHGMLVSPVSRNAVDRFLPPFRDGKSSSQSCVCGNKKEGCDSGVRAAAGGQSCLWFSQGCIIGCPSCSGVGSHSGGAKPDAQGLCNSTASPTLPKYAWTMNRWAVEGSVNDSYRLNPWRSPGRAPVADACGKAGGTDRAHFGPGEALFSDTVFAKGGDLGSQVLQASPEGTTWRAGATVEVSWGIRYNHGGGYQYRLCPAEEALTEQCFSRTPLAFVRGKQALQWNNGTRLTIGGTFVDEGTFPAGSTWAMNPIPRIDFDSTKSGQPRGFKGCNFVNGTVKGKACIQFDPPCAEDKGWHSVPGTHHSVDVEGPCSGDWLGGVVVDEVLVPEDLKPGKYVLGWRWDCEETAQVWSSCADVTILAKQADLLI